MWLHGAIAPALIGPCHDSALPAGRATVGYATIGRL